MYSFIQKVFFYLDEIQINCKLQMTWYDMKKNCTTKFQNLMAVHSTFLKELVSIYVMWKYSVMMSLSLFCKKKPAWQAI